MTNWKQTVKVKHLIGREVNTTQEAQTLAWSVAEALENSEWDGGVPLDYIISSLNSIDVEDYATTDEAIEDVDNLLYYMYDLADRQRVWIA